MMNRDRISGIFLFGLAVAVFLKSLAYPLGTLRKPGGGLFPLIASILLMGLSALLTIQAFRGKETDKASQAPFFSEKEAPRRILLGFAGCWAIVTSSRSSVCPLHRRVHFLPEPFLEDTAGW